MNFWHCSKTKFHLFKLVIMVDDCYFDLVLCVLCRALIKIGIVCSAYMCDGVWRVWKQYSKQFDS